MRLSRVRPQANDRSHSADVELRPRHERRDPAVGQAALRLGEHAAQEHRATQHAHALGKLAEEIELEPLVALLAAHEQRVGGDVDDGAGLGDLEQARRRDEPAPASYWLVYMWRKGSASDAPAMRAAWGKPQASA